VLSHHYSVHLDNLFVSCDLVNRLKEFLFWFHLIYWSEVIRIAPSHSSLLSPTRVISVAFLHAQVGDDVFFERESGLLEEGFVEKLFPQDDKVMALVRYKERAWSAYIERRDVEGLLLRDQLVSKSRTRRNARPVSRYQPQEQSGSAYGSRQSRKPKLLKGSRKSHEKKRRRRRKRLKEAARLRRARRERRRTLALRFLSEGLVDGVILSEQERAELMGLLSVSEAVHIREALTLSSSESEDDNLDQSQSSEDESGSSSSSDSSSTISTFGEQDSESEAESGAESELGLSDVSTDSCPSEPDFLYWSRVHQPALEQLRATGRKRFGLAPKYDSEDSDDVDEEPREMGLASTIMSWTGQERKELLREYLNRPASIARRLKTGAISYKEWCLALQVVSEDSGGVSSLENMSAIKGVKRCDGMRTMYGAIRAPLIQEMIRFAGVTRQDRFLDIGSGLGTVVLQMAAVTGCHATGIELEASRFTISSMLSEELIHLMAELSTSRETGFVADLKNRIEMKNEDVRDHEETILQSTVIYFNNHGVWFDETSSKQGEISVEHWVAKLFARTAVGTRLVILKSIPHLKGNWFSEQMYMARSDWLTWARDAKPLFCYTKLKDTWTCEKCQHENAIVGDDDSLIWEMRCVNSCASRAHRLRARPGQPSE